MSVETYGVVGVLTRRRINRRREDLAAEPAAVDDIDGGHLPAVPTAGSDCQAKRGGDASAPSPLTLAYRSLGLASPRLPAASDPFRSGDTREVGSKTSTGGLFEYIPAT